MTWHNHSFFLMLLWHGAEFIIDLLYWSMMNSAPCHNSIKKKLSIKKHFFTRVLFWKLTYRGDCAPYLETHRSSTKDLILKTRSSTFSIVLRYHSMARAIWIKVNSSWLLLQEHQSAYLRGPKSTSIKIPPFRPHFLKISKTIFFHNVHI